MVPKLNRLATMIFALALLIPSNAAAQETDTVKSRYRVVATTFGIGKQQLLDTYLTPLQYAGPEVSIARETMRFTRFNERLSVQNFFRIYAAAPTRNSYTMYSVLANWNYGMHYQLQINDNFKILVGGLGDFNGGCVYNSRNSNNPASAKAFIDLDASAMAIYKFKIGNYHLTARYQANMPVAGVMFSPDYGESYYEMFYLGYHENMLNFTSFHNHLSLRQMFTIDFPCRRVTFRAGYYWEIEQSYVNNLKTHTYSHSFMLGFVRNLKLIRDKKGKQLPVATNPF